MLKISGIVIISVSSGNYKCKQCLEEAIKAENLNNLSIIQNGESYSILMSKNVQRYRSAYEKNQMADQLEEINEEILPVYTLNHAIHTLKEQGFSFKNQKKIKGGKRLIFSKYVGAGTDMSILTYTIDVLPGEKRIIIDGGNMPALTCRKYLSKFEKSMGIVESFTPHLRTSSESMSKQRQKIKMG